MDKRTILAIVLSIAVLWIYQTFFWKPVPRSPVPPARVTQPAKVAPLAPSPQAELPLLSPLPPPTGGGRDIRVETPLYVAVFNEQGATLKSFKLKHYYESLPPERDYHLPPFLNIFGGKDAQTNATAGQLVEMVNVAAGMPLPLSVSFPGSSLDPGEQALYRSSINSLKLVGGAQKGQLVFTAAYPGKLTVEKIYSFDPARYAFELQVRLTNLVAVPLNENISLNWYEYLDHKQPQDKYGHAGPVCYVQKNVERQDVAKLEQRKELGPGVIWGGFENKYFLAAMIPQSPSLTSMLLTKDNYGLIGTSLVGPRALIPPAQTGTFDYCIYLGPKDYSLLKAFGAGLENAIDFGPWLKWLAMPLLVILKFLYCYVHNYGVAIIILTVLIKLLFWPLGNKSYRSMKEMQKLQPKLAALREKFKDDKARLGQETMALYKAHHVNPLGGCLPILIQIPVFFSLLKTTL